MAKILVAEDDIRLRLTYDVVLKKEGHEIRQAVDGREAMALAEDFKPDLILLDMMMPNMDGLAFLRKFNPRKHPGVKIVISTNLENSELMDEAAKLGAKRFVLKSSVSPKQLAQLIQRTLSS